MDPSANRNLPRRPQRATLSPFSPTDLSSPRLQLHRIRPYSESNTDQTNRHTRYLTAKEACWNRAHFQRSRASPSLSLRWNRYWALRAKVSSRLLRRRGNLSSTRWATQATHGDQRISLLWPTKWCRTTTIQIRNRYHRFSITSVTWSTVSAKRNITTINSTILTANTRLPSSLSLGTTMAWSRP